MVSLAVTGVVATRVVVVYASSPVCMIVGTCGLSVDRSYLVNASSRPTSPP